MHYRPPHLLLVVLLSGSFVACSQGGGDDRTPRAAAQTVGVEVQPPSATVGPTQKHQLAAVVTGTANTAVTWSIVEPGTVGTVTTAGLYTAPVVAGTFHVRATSVASPAAFGDSTVTVQLPTCTSFTYSAWSACASGSQSRTVVSASPAYCTGGSPVLTQACQPVSVTISPATGAVDACKALAFSATVANATNTAVTWSVQEGAAGGAIASNGVYTAPSTGGTYHVVATSVADGSALAVNAVTVTERVLSVAVTPASSTLSPSGTAQFSATVTTTCGTFAAAGP
jgi:hypothetical protein